MPRTDDDVAVYAVALSLMKADVGIAVQRFCASTGQMPSRLTVRITSRSVTDCIAEIDVPEAQVTGVVG